MGTPHFSYNQSFFVSIKFLLSMCGKFRFELILANFRGVNNIVHGDEDDDDNKFMLN